MPCITTTYAHTGAGTPVVLSVQSGSAPLAPRLIDLVEQAETALETDGPVLVDVRVTREENTYPMIPAGQPARNMVG